MVVTLVSYLTFTGVSRAVFLLFGGGVAKSPSEPTSVGMELNSESEGSWTGGLAPDRV